MDGRYFAEFFAYNCWAHSRVWECVEHLADDAYHQDLGYSVGSIHNQLVHTLSVEHWWFTFLSTGELDFLDRNLLSTREAIRAQWDATAAMIRAYLDRLTPEELAREVRPAFWPEGRRPIQVYQAITQVLNHSTDHRAQILAGLHHLGAPTVGQDLLIIFSRGRRRRSGKCRHSRLTLRAQTVHGLSTPVPHSTSVAILPANRPALSGFRRTASW
jgi:uncharacterized damage-inducible protein DinB